MTANKHTPGPWIVHKGSRWSHVKAANGDYIMEASRRSVARHHADAHLIAAAPELLDALSTKVKDAEQRVFEDWLESNSPSGDHEQVQRQWLESSDYRDFVAEWGDQLAAIAKATGSAA